MIRQALLELAGCGCAECGCVECETAELRDCESWSSTALMSLNNINDDDNDYCYVIIM